MAMPKTPMNEYGNASRWQDYVGFTRQVPMVQPKPKATGVKRPANDHFRFSIARLDPRHLSTAGGINSDRDLSRPHLPMALRRFHPKAIRF